jgi:hypothetical protein
MTPKKPGQNGETGSFFDTLKHWSTYVGPVLIAVCGSWFALYLQVQLMSQKVDNHLETSERMEEKQNVAIQQNTFKIFANSERISKLED